MSLDAITRALHHSRARGTAKVVLLGIAEHDGPGGAWPSIETLAGYANVDARNVRHALRALQALGELEVRVQAGGRPETRAGQRTNLYAITLSCPWTCDRSTHHRDISTPLTNATPDAIVTPDDSDRGGLTESTGEPLTTATAEPSLEPLPEIANHSEPATTDRARERCGESGHTDDAGHCRQCASERLAEVGRTESTTKARRAV
jgi:DNA-binding transcriptional MocR family regulator